MLMVIYGGFSVCNNQAQELQHQLVMLHAASTRHAVNLTTWALPTAPFFLSAGPSPLGLPRAGGEAKSQVAPVAEAKTS